MVLLAFLIPGLVAYLALARSVPAEKHVVAYERVPLMAFRLRLLSFFSGAVVSSAADSAGACSGRPNIEIVSRVGMPLRAVGHLLLPQSVALHSVGDVALAGAHVQVRWIDAGRIVAAMAGILDPGLPTDERRSSKLTKQPAVGPMLLPSEIEEAVAGFISGADPSPAFRIATTIDARPEGSGYFADSHASNSTSCTVPNGVN